MTLFNVRRGDWIPLFHMYDMVYMTGPVLIRLLLLTCLASCALGDDAFDEDAYGEDAADATGATTVWYTTITHEYFLPSAKIAGEVHKVFKSEAEWVAFWGEASPGIDFAHNWAIFYTPGTQRTDLATETGWQSKLAKVSLSATGKTLSITTKVEHNGTCATRRAKPFLTATIKKPTVAPTSIRFYRTETTRSGN
jgi:hypothetical protein